MPVLPVIQTYELTKEYRHPLFPWLMRARALSHLTLAVEPGEIFGLLGPNGSGKSTTIKLILGLIFPTSGQAAIFGQRPDDQEVKSRIGFLPEESYLYRFLSAEETLDFYGRIFGLSRQDRKKRVESLLNLTGLWSERERPVIEFSKGMQRRIGIAQSLINDPDLVIFDEPTTGLDPIGTREIKDLILYLRDKGKTIFMSSHLLADVEDVCDRVAILYGGRAQAIGRIHDLLSAEKLTQITAELEPETVEEIEELIREREGEDTEIKISPPQERLEQFFLRVVNEARQRRDETSGAAASTGSLDFMDEPKPEETLLRNLAAGGKEIATPVELSDEAPTDAGLLDKFTVQEKSENETVIPSGKKPDVDHSVLDSLTRKEE
jgi:ABC-2 type transport system ATP-binding protein